MRRHIRPPSASTVIASLALMAALGGTSYAAATISSGDIKNNTVRSADVKNNSLTGRDVKNSSLTSGDVRNGSLLAKDFKSGQLPAGPAGPAGPGGAAGGLGKLVYVEGDFVTIGAGKEDFVEAECPPGFIVTGGGVGSSANLPPNSPEFTAAPYTINSSHPSAGDGSGDPGNAAWGVWMENLSGQSQDSAAFAVCADAEAAGDLVGKKSGPRKARR